MLFFSVIKRIEVVDPTVIVASLSLIQLDPIVAAKPSAIGMNQGILSNEGNCLSYGFVKLEKFIFVDAILGRASSEILDFNSVSSSQLFVYKLNNPDQLAKENEVIGIFGANSLLIK